MTEKSPPTIRHALSCRKFLTPDDGAVFHDLVRDRYQGFVHIPTAEDFHKIATAQYWLQEAEHDKMHVWWR